LLVFACFCLVESIFFKGLRAKKLKNPLIAQLAPRLRVKRGERPHSSLPAPDATDILSIGTS
jgi:hypothetical protein